MVSSISEKTAIVGPSSDRPKRRPKSQWTWRREMPRRHFMAVLAFTGFANLYALRVIMSIAVVAMTSDTKTIADDGTETVIPAEFDWDPTVQGLILSSFFYGYIMTQLPAGYLAARFGGIRIFGIGVFGAGILSIITPLLARASLYLLLTGRVMEGLLEGVTYPAMHAIWSRWAPVEERGKMVTFAFAGSYFGTAFAFPVSYLIQTRLGWPYIFIIFGALALFWTLCWALMAAETPGVDKLITEEERVFIHSSVGPASTKTWMHLEVPWRRVVTSFPVWAIIIAHFCENWGFYTLLTELPIFLRDVRISGHDYYGAIGPGLPYLFMAFSVPFGGALADCLQQNGFTTGRVRKLLTCSAFVLQAIFLMAAAYVTGSCDIVSALCLAVGIGGFAWAGFGVNHLDIAPAYASILMGLSNTFATLPGMISPILTGQLVTHQSPEEWKMVFFIAIAVYLVGAIFYGLFASGEEQSWATQSCSVMRDESSATDDMPFGEASCE